MPPPLSCGGNIHFLVVHFPQILVSTISQERVVERLKDLYNVITVTYVLEFGIDIF